MPTVKLIALVPFAGLTMISSMALGADPCSELADARSFSFGQEIEGGKEVSYKKAFSQVLYLPNPGHCFREIVNSGNLQGKMFAVVALREIDPSQFRIEVERLRRQGFSVVTMATQERGIIERKSSDTVLKQISEGVFQPAFRFYKKHRPRRD